MSDVILTDVADGVAVVTMNRPDVRNALDAEQRRAVPRTLRDASNRAAIQARGSAQQR